MVVTRIAPSPTGDPHIGTAYMALFDYALAKQQSGTFILRVEDTDQKRYNPESEARVLDALEWLGLTPDESPLVGGPNAPYRQTERKEIYQAHAQRLLETGKAYRAFETPEELETIRHELKRRGVGHGYDGRGRFLSAEESERRAAAGEPFVVRLITPDEGETVVHDLLRGEIRIPNREVPDAVLLKSDGMPTYHLAVVVDDHLMGVTHALRGEEWIPTAPIHVLLYAAFGWQEPVWIHMPLLKNAEGKKLSKRKDDVNLDSYRRQGFLPEALINYLGTMGWSMPDGREFFSLEDMTRHLSFERVSMGGSIFDPKRLKHYNARYIRELPLEELARRVKPFLAEAGVEISDKRYLLEVLDITRSRVETLAEFPRAVAYFFDESFAFEPEARKKLAAGQKYLEDLERAFARLEDYDEDSVDDMLHDYVQEQSVGMGKVLQPLRVALTGTMQSPGITELVSVLGRDRVMKRLGRALSLITVGLPDDRLVRAEASATAPGTQTPETQAPGTKAPDAKTGVRG